MLRALALLLVLRSAGAWAVLAVSRLPFRADKKYLRLGGSPESRVSRYLYLWRTRDGTCLEHPCTPFRLRL